jgi:hypothetical protein
MTSTPSESSVKSSIDSISPNEELLDFADIARDIQNRASCRVRSESTKAWLFRKFFGMSVRVVEILWELVVCDKLQPGGGHPEHLLWMLFFMKVYPKQGPGWLVVGASASAVNPKTHRKWVWAFIEAIAELIDVVVSDTTMWGWCRLLYFLWWQLVIYLTVPVLASVRKHKENGVKKLHFFFHTHSHNPASLPHPQPQINFDSQKKGDILNICLMTVDGTNFRVPQKGTATKGIAFASHKYAGKSTLSLKDKILIWQNILYRVVDMSTQYNILYHTTQYIVFNKKLFFSIQNSRCGARLLGSKSNALTSS